MLNPIATKNNIHFLNNLPSTIADEETLMTYDVTSLYSNIKHDLGIEAVSYWLKKEPEQLGKFLCGFVIDGLRLLLHNNYFEFNGEYYLQKVDTAMGTRMAPCYANLTLGYLEETLYSCIETKFNSNIMKTLEKRYFRYLDDIFCIWDQSWGDKCILYEILQSLHDEINFTCDTFGDSVNFLDINVYKEKNCICTDIFYKKTDARQYLNYRSHHPRHIKNNIPFNLARRICTIVSDKDRKNIRLQELKTYLLNNNYPIKVIEKGISMAVAIPQSQLREEKSETTKSLDIPFVSTFDKSNTFQKVKDVYRVVQEDPSLKPIFGEVKLINCRRQPKNLKQMLTRAAFREEKEQFQVTKCNGPKCQICNFIIEGNYFQFPQQIFYVNAHMTCNVRNVLYVIKCAGCGELYIGETSDFRLRVNNHRDHCRNAGGLFVNKHINNCAKQIVPPFFIMPFFKIKKDDCNFRRYKEKYFIEKYKPFLNK